MLLAASGLKGYAIEASDGPMGAVDDILFDDGNWKIRWLVARSGTWLSYRKVLLHPSCARQLDYQGETLSVALTKAQVESSPDLAQDEPVSRQMESRLYDYYGWDPSWGLNYFPEGNIDTQAAATDADGLTGDPHLRSTAAISGYHVHATDGAIGHIETFLLDDDEWGIRYLVIETRNWVAGDHVLISPHAVERIDWAGREVHLNVTRDQVRASPRWDPVAMVDRAYQQGLHSYYGWPDLPPQKGG